MSLIFETVHCQKLQLQGGREEGQGRARPEEREELTLVLLGDIPAWKFPLHKEEHLGNCQGPLLLQSVTYVTYLSPVWPDVYSCAH